MRTLRADQRSQQAQETAQPDKAPFSDGSGARGLTREQAEAFLATLWPCGHMSHLDNPTRTFFAALLGRVPQGIPYTRSPFGGEDDFDKLRIMAGILRQIASHIEVTGEEAALSPRSARHG